MIVFDPGTLRQCRKKLRLKQADVANKICKSAGCVSKQENGEMRVSADDLAAYANLYDVSIGSFYKETIEYKNMEGLLWQKSIMP
ncbi:Helix-turn-helix domain-containing protein [Selenomonas ruminantium]|uniref:Helix-turn-helix domain-containing protein n=1 Tax=Selenomonas ruminantium TaxID=971 RepID=A0A1H4AIV5_SELRU|nr:Helix-turn-helix domain-containing protein [Selenomonas ruminantium]